ncbi:MAG: M4 family metallopeptidase [Gammaproteobacteria bacterium]|nr:M4 family metallopeptidase [Gammaproteobacteria bacterium]
MINFSNIQKTLVIIVCAMLPQFVTAAGTYEPDQGMISALRSQGATVARHRDTGALNFMGFPRHGALVVPGTNSSLAPEHNARTILNAYGTLFGIGNVNEQLALLKENRLADGRSMARFQQLHNGVPVIGAELIVNMDAQARLLSINGETAPKLVLAISPRINQADAMQTAIVTTAKHHNMAAASLRASAPVLSVYEPQLLSPRTFPASLVWRIEVTPTQLAPVREFVLVDALNGNIALQFNQVHEAKNRSTYTANNTTTLPGTLLCTEASGDACTSGSDTDADAAQLYAGDTYDFFSVNHGRDSLDNAGMLLISSVHYGATTYKNAFWNGLQMAYGDGFSAADDVVGHELTHGVTEKTSNLFYFYQSGAINESFSDMWGEFIDLTNTGGNDSAGVRWLMGEDIPGIGAIRSMANPPAYGDPDRIGSAIYHTETTDNGGVHINSGINNKAAYLMVDGGTFNGQTIAAMGIPRVAKIYYEVQTNLLTSASDYYDLYNALYQGCLNLVGTSGITANDCTNVRNATLATEMHLEPSTGFNPNVSLCPAGQQPVNAFFDGFESGLGNWTLTHNQGAFDWVAWLATYGPGGWGPYATSGTESLFGLNDGIISDKFAQISVAVPNVSGHAPYLHFRHAYMFEPGNYDGGVVEYSTNGGGTWVDANFLPTAGRVYGGVISTLYSNPLAGRFAFVGDSHGYVDSRYALDTLAGQAVRFRWRVGTDTSVGAYGWWLDDVRVYYCNTVPVAVGQNISVAEDGSIGITVTATDADGDSLSYSIASAPANGQLTGTAPNLTYTPNANYFGADSFSFTASDGVGGSHTATVSITVTPVNDAPTVSTIADLPTDEDTATAALPFTVADVDNNVVNLTVQATSSDVNLVPVANIVFGGSGANRDVTVTPATDANGSATITLTVSDGTATATSSFVLTVNPVNDAPTAPTLMTPTDGATGVDSASAVFGWNNSTDVDGDAISYELIVCEDSLFTTGCSNTVVAGAGSLIVAAGLGGGSLMLLGLAGAGIRRRQLVWAVPLYIAVALLSACGGGGGGGGGGAPVPPPTGGDKTATLTGLKANTTYYWKVVANDGNGGLTDSTVWSFTTKP